MHVTVLYNGDASPLTLSDALDVRILCFVLYFSLGHVYFDTWFFTVVQDPLRYLGRGKPLLSQILKKVSVSNPIKNQITRLCSVVEPTVLHICTCLGYSVIIGVR